MAAGGSMSPADWPPGALEAAEAFEAKHWAPRQARVVRGHEGLVATVVSRLSVEAGLQALRLGGTAADGAAAAALTQIATLLGSVVSYAGILSGLYFEAASGRVHSIDAGWNSYRGETDPASIPASDLGPLSSWNTPGPAGADGRKTLVPGFMAGLEALHRRFGALPFASLFEPAIWFAERGVALSPMLAAYFAARAGRFAKTEGGRAFLRQAGGDAPSAGARFVQADLAATLRAVAGNGAREMYDGAWARACVEAVRAAGGKASATDFAAYAPVWSDPVEGEAFGCRVFCPGAPNLAHGEVLQGLYMAEAMGLDRRGPPWRDPTTFRDLVRIATLLSSSPGLRPEDVQRLIEDGVDVAAGATRGRAFAQALARALDRLHAPAGRDPRHSASIVVVDAAGDIAAVTHTINTVTWGDTGLVVGGVPLADAAGFQQAQLSALPPGGRLPNTIACTLTLKGDRPVLATAPVGASLAAETLKTLLSVLGQGATLADVVAAPPMLLSFDREAMGRPLRERAASAPAGLYGPGFLDAVRAAGQPVDEVPPEVWRAMRGTLAAVGLDPASGEAFSAEAADGLALAGAL